MGTGKKRKAIPWLLFIACVCTAPPADGQAQDQTDLKPPEYSSVWDNTLKGNIWVSLARSIGRESLCLSVTDPADPFRSCLVGVPWQEAEWQNYSKTCLPDCKTPLYYQGPFVKCFLPNSVTPYGEVLDAQPNYPRKNFSFQNTLPHELQILGTLPSPYCFYFEVSSSISEKEKLNVSPKPSSAYSQFNTWCKKSLYEIARIRSPPFTTMLPPKSFLICGQRVWKGFPAGAVGGPCTIGQLSLHSPDLNTILTYKNITEAAGTKVRTKRDSQKTYLPFSANCNSAVHFWTAQQNMWGSLIIPAIGTSHALNILNELGCWVPKETNATADILEQMLNDVKEVKTATLQNRAAIDYLLLVNGHGCQEFEGMCCLNFSSKSESIHAKINSLRNMVKELTINQGKASGEILDWFPNLNISLGIKRFLAILIIGCLVLLLVLALVPCLISCVKRSLSKTVSVDVAVSLKNKNGGDVGKQQDDKEGIFLEWMELSA